MEKGFLPKILKVIRRYLYQLNLNQGTKVMIKKDNQLLGLVKSNCFNVENKFLIAILILSFFMLFGCTSNRGQLSAKSLKVESSVKAKINSHYRKWQNTPYRYGGMTLAGSDCSGLVMNFYKSKFSRTLPRSTVAQAQLGYRVTKPKAGDLVFFKTNHGNSGLHVGIYYANGKFLHVSSSKGVVFSDLNNSYWKKHYWQTRRLAEDLTANN